MNAIVDQQARDLAARALALIEAHERVCEQRAIAANGWRASIDKKLDEVGKGVNGIYSRIWVAASGVIVALLGCIGFLIENHGL